MTKIPTVNQTIHPASKVGSHRLEMYLNIDAFLEQSLKNLPCKVLENLLENSANYSGSAVAQ